MSTEAALAICKAEWADARLRYSGRRSSPANQRLFDATEEFLASDYALDAFTKGWTVEQLFGMGREGSGGQVVRSGSRAAAQLNRSATMNDDTTTAKVDGELLHGRDGTFDGIDDIEIRIRSDGGALSINAPDLQARICGICGRVTINDMRSRRHRHRDHDAR